MTLLQTYKRLFSPIKDDPIAFMQNIFEAICVASYMIFSIEIMRRILLEINKDDLWNFYKLIFLYIGVTIVASVGRFFIKHWGWSRISFDGVSRETQKYLTKFIEADGNEIERIGTWRFISILDKWLYQWMDILFDVTFRWTQNTIMVFYAIYTIGKIHILGWLCAGVLMIISALVATYANIWMTKKRQLRRIEQNEASHQTVIALMSKNELLQNSGLWNIFSKIQVHLKKAKKYQEVVNIGFLIIEEFPRFTFLLLRVGVYIFIAEKIFAVEWWIIELGIFITIMAIAEKSLNEFLHLLRDILREFSSISLLWSTFDSLTPIKWYSTGIVFSPHPKDIIIDSISYGYNESKVFSDFSLTIAHGKKTALVWVSGGGKTTLMKLIAGYLHPESWYIAIMGNRLDETALKSYYPHIGYLTQDPGVFDATIRENLMSALPSLQREMSTKVNSTIVEERAPWGEARGDLVSEQNPQSLRDSSFVKELLGKSFCVTGSFDSLSRDDIHGLVEQHGGEVRTSVSARLDYLIAGDNAGSKKSKAEEYGVQILSLSDFQNLIG